jgi:hypothetical protein
MPAGLRIGCFENGLSAGLLQMPVLLHVYTWQTSKQEHIKGKNAGKPEHGTNVVKVCQNDFRAQKLYK